MTVHRTYKTLHLLAIAEQVDDYHWHVCASLRIGGEERQIWEFDARDFMAVVKVFEKIHPNLFGSKGWQLTGGWPRYRLVIDYRFPGQ